MPKKVVSAIVFMVFSFMLIGCSQTNSQGGVTPNKPANQSDSKPFSFLQKVPAEGLDNKVQDLITTQITTQTKRGKSFTISSFVVDKGFVLLNALVETYPKRYSDDQIKSFYLEKEALLKNKIAVSASIIHLGGADEQSKISLDNNTYEYFFLENEKGDYVKAGGQDPLAIGDDEVSWLHDQTTLYLYFPEDEVDKMMKESKQLFLTFKGLKIMPTDKDNRMELKYPFNEYYKDQFPELIPMIQQIES